MYLDPNNSLSQIGTYFTNKIIMTGPTYIFHFLAQRFVWTPLNIMATGGQTSKTEIPTRL